MSTPGQPESGPTKTDDLVEIQQLLGRYAVTITQQDIDGLVAVFTRTEPIAPSAKPTA